MLRSFITGAKHIYIATGATDFRKQSESLSALVSFQFQMDPYAPACVFIFCNKRRNALKVLRYDRNGFILASKKLVDKMKFQWPREKSEVEDISMRQVEWLLQGLSIDQKNAWNDVEMVQKNTCF